MRVGIGQGLGKFVEAGVEPGIVDVRIGGGLGIVADDPTDQVCVPGFENIEAPGGGRVVIPTPVNY